MNHSDQILSSKYVSNIIRTSFVLLMLSLVMSNSAFAQPPTYTIDRAKILKTAQEKYGVTPDNANISEQELIAELLKRGVNPANMDEVEKVAVEIIKERQAKQKPKVNEAKKDIPKATKDDNKPPAKPKETIVKDAQVKPKAEAKVVKKEAGEGEQKITVVSDIPVAKGTRVYGQDFPSNISLQVDPKNINPKGSYIIGAGDEFSVSIYGDRYADFKAKVNEDGFVSIPEVPGSRIYLKGLSYEKAKKMLRSRIGRYYNLSVSSLEINLVYARVVTVHILGEVNAKGTQVITGMNTAFNALAASNGLTDIASVRNIKLIRSGQNEQILDIYKYMNDPIYGENFYLQDNDYIVVPPLGRVVTINGLVKRPAKYELINGENLKAVIEYAAGLKANAYTENITINRVIDNSVQLINVNLQDILDGQSSDFLLLDEDVISIQPINTYNKNMVQLQGEFFYPGTYAFDKGKKLDYYLTKAQIKPEARTDTAYVIRKYLDGSVTYLKLSIDNILNNSNSDDNIEILPQDVITVTAQSSYLEKYNVSISGDLRNEGIDIAFDSTLTIRDLIFLSGGLEPTFANKASLVRTSIATGEKEYIFFNVLDVMNPNSNTNTELKLQPQDVVKIYNESNKIEKFDINIGGAVRNPSSFAYNEELSLQEVIYMAGGLQLNASNKLIIERTNLKTLQKEYIDVSLDNLLLEGSNLNNEIKLSPLDNIKILPIQSVDEYTVSITGQVRNPGSFTWGPGLKLGDVIIQSGGIKPEAANSRVEISRVNVKGDGAGTEVIVAQFDIDINQELAGGTDFELEKYDQIIVRTAPNFELQQNIRIEGEVKFPGTYALLGEQESLLSILNRAGGLTEEAFPLGATLVRTEDEAGVILLDLDDVMDKKEKSVFNYVLKAGDQIVIPKVTDFVMLSGAVENPKIANVGKLNIPFHKGKRAGFYVNRYGQGVDRNLDGRRKYIIVEYPNGDVKKTQNFGLFTVTPKVTQGSRISVGVKPPKKPKVDEAGKEKEPVDWGEVIERSVTQITAVLTLYVLLQQVF